ncbi:MAG TPA: hypothetical protein VMS11_02550 [Solirubrobacterales bacterium]|nr:hypothetical protein [Solirubrobacterales bacterium]
MDLRRKSSLRLGPVAAWAVLGALVIVLVGCGGSDSGGGTAQQQELEQARREGAVAAHRQERIAELQRPEVSQASRTFHSPSRNIGCAILPDGALCSVVTSNETFVFNHGAPASIEPGAVLSGSAGDLAPYGSTVRAGSIVCSIPAAPERRGVTCSDSATGHGFEASRIAARQSTY